MAFLDGSRSKRVRPSHAVVFDSHIDPAIHGEALDRLVVVPVGRFDRRALDPVTFAPRIPARAHRALHVARDERDVWELGTAWMASGLSMPLHTVEGDGDVARTIARHVESELESGFDHVVVLVGRVVVQGRVARVLHRRTADAIGEALAGVPGALVGLMTVASV